MPEQERFAQIVTRYEKLRAQMRESTRQAELLFQGLLYESFGG
jgi:type I restriction enzyme, S subunit